MIQLNGKEGKIIRQETIPELDHADIAVIGGGLKGASAALEAAACGKRVVLIEKNTFVGGLCEGSVWEWNAPELSEITDSALRGIREKTAQELLERLLEKSVILYLHTMAVETVRSENRIEAVIVATKRGLKLIRAAAVIDATGDGSFSEAAGAEGRNAARIASMTFGMGNVDYEGAAEWLEKEKLPYAFHIEEKGSAQERGELTLMLPEWQKEKWRALLEKGKLVFHFYGKNRISQISGLAAAGKTLSEALGCLLGAAEMTVTYLREHVGGFENAWLDWTAPCVGTRGGFCPEGRPGTEGMVKNFENLVSLKLFTMSVENAPLKSWRCGKEAGRRAVLCVNEGKRFKDLQCGMQVQRTAEYPVEKTCDVLIVGGGASGIAAAIAAARKGMKTVLVERNSLLGGDMLAGGLSWLSFYNLYREFQVPEKQAVFGIGYEITRRLLQMGGSPGFYEDIAPFTQESKGTHGDRECMRRLFLQMLKEAGVEVLLETLFLDAVVEEENYILGNVMRGALVQECRGRYVVRAEVVIDASGDGDVAWYAGANCKEYASHGVGMAFGMTNVDFEQALAYAREKNAVAHEAYGQEGEMRGKLVKYSLRTYFIPELFDKVKSSGIHNSFCVESCHEREASYINGVTTPQSNILDPKEATDTIIDLRRRLFRASDFLKENIPGFEEAQLCWCTPIPGARQTRCIDCQCSISGNDVENGVIPEDSIGLFGGHDGHYAGYKIKDGGWYGIPYRAMLPHFIRNLFTIGRMLSADWAAYMSTRLNVSCFVQGQAAGTAAAMAVREGIRIDQIDTGKLQKELKSDGVYLG